MIALLGAAGCIVFDEPINVPPEPPSIVVPESPLRRGSATRFSAEARDRDQEDPLTIEWRIEVGACTAEPSTPATAVGTTFDWNPSSKGPHCLWVSAVDRHGARSSRALALVVDNAPPRAHLDIQAPARTAAGMPFPLFSGFRISGRGSTDPDGDDAGLTFAWQLMDPAGTQNAPTPCADEARDACFTLARPGTHVVSLSVTDTDGDQHEASLALPVAEDRPPCLVDLQPAVTRVVREAGANTTFSVRVDDDGDPLPAPDGHTSMTGVTWSVRLAPAQPFERWIIVNTRQFTLPGKDVRIGDQIAVRVDVKDRVARPACAAEQDECTSAPGCRQRVTWIVEYR